MVKSTLLCNLFVEDRNQVVTAGQKLALCYPNSNSDLPVRLSAACPVLARLVVCHIATKTWPAILTMAMALLYLVVQCGDKAFCQFSASQMVAYEIKLCADSQVNTYLAPRVIQKQQYLS